MIRRPISRKDLEEILPFLEDASSWDQVAGILQFIVLKDPLVGSILYAVSNKTLEFLEEIDE